MKMNMNTLLHEYGEVQQLNMQDDRLYDDGILLNKTVTFACLHQPLAFAFIVCVTAYSLDHPICNMIMANIASRMSRVIRLLCVHS